MGLREYFLQGTEQERRIKYPGRSDWFLLITSVLLWFLLGVAVIFVPIVLLYVWR